MCCQPKEVPQSNHQLGGIVVIPFDAVEVVVRKLMMQVVVSLPEGDERSDA